MQQSLVGESGTKIKTGKEIYRKGGKGGSENLEDEKERDEDRNHGRERAREGKVNENGEGGIEMEKTNERGRCTKKEEKEGNKNRKRS